MERINEYRTYIEQILRDYATVKPAYGDVELQLVFDHEHDRYRLTSVGWMGPKRIRGDILHVDIINGKIWIQHDGTETGIAGELVACGVPKQDIVLAFQAPYRRKFTEFAEA